MDFRTLRADEIDCRIKVVKENGVSVLLYKDARVDQNILDETVGALNWQRKHSRDNANCTVEIWDESKKQWVSKEDTGTESNTEAEKGLASDSFKRACFNWGIGRELYSAPFIWIADADIKTDKDGNSKCFEKFKVSHIAYDGNKNIVELEIKNEKGKVVYTLGSKAKVEPPKDDKATLTQIGKIKQELLRTGVDQQAVLDRFKIKSLNELTKEQASSTIKSLAKSKDKE